jgi:hypothetical protein
MTARSLTFSTNPTAPREGFNMRAQQHREADAFLLALGDCKPCRSLVKILFWLSAFALSTSGVWSLAALARELLATSIPSWFLMLAFLFCLSVLAAGLAGARLIPGRQAAAATVARQKF